MNGLKLILVTEKKYFLINGFKSNTSTLTCGVQ